MRSVPIPVPETTWTLVVNGERIARGTASPGHDRELAAGLLITEGFVRTPDDLLEISVEHRQLCARLDARVSDAAFAAATAERQHRDETGCGLLHFVACARDDLRIDRNHDVPDDAILADHLHALFDACRESHPGGGVHAAAVTGSRTTPFRSIDVSRHAAVAKAAGSAFLNGTAGPDCGLVLTARISGRIALTAARSGIGWIASRSVPTTLAVAIASATGVTLVARAGSGDIHTFAPQNGSGAV